MRHVANMITKRYLNFLGMLVAAASSIISGKVGHGVGRPKIGQVHFSLNILE